MDNIKTECPPKQCDQLRGHSANPGITLGTDNLVAGVGFEPTTFGL